jgi:hypothetical protein
MNLCASQLGQTQKLTERLARNMIGCHMRSFTPIVNNAAPSQGYESLLRPTILFLQNVLQCDQTGKIPAKESQFSLTTMDCKKSETASQDQRSSGRVHLTNCLSRYLYYGQFNSSSFDNVGGTAIPCATIIKAVGPFFSCSSCHGHHMAKFS